MERPVTRLQLIGRESDLSFVESLVDAAAASRGSVVLISGEAGIGKSRLLSEVATAVRAPPLLRTQAQCYEYLQGALGPIADLIAQLRAARPDALRGRPEVADVLDYLARADEPSPSSREIDRRRLFQGIAHALDLFASDRVLLVVLDDVHWADRSTLEFLQFFCGSIDAKPIVLLAAFRSGDADQSDAFRKALASLSRGPCAHQRGLRPLRAADIRRILRAHEHEDDAPHLDARLLSSIAQRAEGNPLFAEEMLKSVRDAAPVATGDLPLPLSIRESTLTRLGRLRAADRECIRCASVLGRRFSPSLVAAAAQVPHASAIDALGAATAQQLVISEPDGSTLRFTHDLTRRAVYDSLLPAHARIVHARIAAALEAEAPSARRTADLAYHYWMSSDSAKASAFNEAAGDRAMGLAAFAEAAEHYERARTALGDSSTPRTAMLDEKLAGCLYQLGAGNESATRYERARAFFKAAHDRESAARLGLRIAAIRWSEGREDDGIAECRRAIELVDVQSKTFYRAHAYLGHFLLDRDVDGAFAHLAQAERFAGVPEPADASVFHQSRALARAVLGDVEGALEDHRATVDIALRQGDYAIAVRNLGNLGLSLIDLGDRSRALAAFDEAAAIIDREDLWDVNAAVCVRQHAWACAQVGELDRARRLIERALEYPVDSARLRLYAAFAGIIIGLRTLDDDLVARHDDRSLLDEALAPGNEALRVTALGFAEICFAHGRDDEGRAVVHRVVESFASHALARDDDGVFSLVAERGAGEDAVTARAFVQRYADETHLPIARAHLQLYDALLARRHADEHRAAAHAQQAQTLYHELGWRWHEARAMEAGGKTREAAALFAAAGDRRSAARLESVLNPVNRQGRSKSDLTRREAEVARLAAGGKSNRDIADALTLSPRTVETHLAAVFGKLNVSTRAELIAKWKDLPVHTEQVSPRRDRR